MLKEAFRYGKCQYMAKVLICLFKEMFLVKLHVVGKFYISIVFVIKFYIINFII